MIQREDTKWWKWCLKWQHKVLTQSDDTNWWHTLNLTKLLHKVMTQGWLKIVDTYWYQNVLNKSDYKNWLQKKYLKFMTQSDGTKWWHKVMKKW